MKVMSSSSAIAAISKAKQKKYILTSKKTISHKDLQGKCFRCGNANHKTKERQRKNLTCHACGKQDHIAPVCLSNRNQRQQGQLHQRSSKKGSASAPASPNLMRDATAAQIYSIPSCNIPTPCIQVTVEPEAKGTPFSHAALPDSSTSTSIISADLVCTYGLQIDPKRTMKLQAVNSAQLACSGSVEAEISFGIRTITIRLI